MMHKQKISWILLFLFFIIISCSPIKGDYYTDNGKEIPNNLVQVTKIVKKSKLIYITVKNSTIDAYNKKLIKKDDVKNIILVLNNYAEIHNDLNTASKEWLKSVKNNGIFTNKEYVYELITKIIVKNRSLRELINDKTDIYVPETLFDSIFKLYKIIEKEK